MHAARTGDVALAEGTYCRGFTSERAETRTGTTAVGLGCDGNRAAAIRVLAEAGADLNVLSKVTAYPRTQNGVLLPARRRVSYVGQTVLPRGGWSAAMYAAREGAVDAVRALGDAHANLDLADPEGTTALIVAVINGHYDVVSALLEKGANPNLADIKGHDAALCRRGHAHDRRHVRPPVSARTTSSTAAWTQRRRC